MKRAAFLLPLIALVAVFAQARAGTLYAEPAVRNAWADTASSGDITDPGDAFVSAGWPSSTTPPARQYFNWILNFNSNGIRYLEQNGVSTWQSTEDYPLYGIARDSSGVVYESLQTSNTGNTPSTSSSWWGPLLGETPTAGDNSQKLATTAFVHTAVTGLAPLASPTFTGTPAAPTPATADSTTKIATTAYVQNNLASYAPLASPALTGTPTSPTATAGTNTTQVATTAFVASAVSGLAPLASPTFTGTPAAPTATTGTNTTQVSTTAFVHNSLASYALLASPALTGTPTSPTAASNTSSTQIATTAFANPSATVAAAGHVTLPSGIIIEWGAFTPTTNPISVSFQYAFPNGVFSLTWAGYGGPTNVGYFNSITKTGFSWYGGQGSGSTSIYYMAIGH